MINTRMTGSVLVIDLANRLDTQTAAETLTALRQQLTDEPAKVLINLVALEFVSSAGLRVILRTAKQVRAYQGALKVSGATGMVREALEISGFDTLLDTYDDENQALGSFS